MKLSPYPADELIAVHVDAVYSFSLLPYLCYSSPPHSLCIHHCPIHHAFISLPHSPPTIPLIDVTLQNLVSLVTVQTSHSHTCCIAFIQISRYK